jgi:hypothetical protein
MIDEKLSNELFLNLVNYVYKPDGIDYSITPEAYMLISDCDLFPPEYIGKQIMLFFNKENDALCGVTPDNKVVQIEYGISPVPVTNSRKTFRNPDFEIPRVSKPKRIPVKRLSQSKTKSKNAALEKRFNIISLIIFLLFIGSIFTLNFKENFYAYTLCLSLCVASWFLWDYKMLRSLKMYIKCLYIAIAIFAFGLAICIISDKAYTQENVYIGFFSLPLTFLLSQRILRLAFISYIGDEPVVDENAGSLNAVYTTTLIIAASAMSYIIGKLLSPYL